MSIRASIAVSLVSAAVVADPCTSGDIELWRGQQEFSNKLSRFAVSSLGQSAGTISKLTKEYPTLNSECAQCFGAMIACGTSNCFFACMISATSPACVSCSSTHCKAPFKTCSGIDSDDDLPLTPQSAPRTTGAPPAVRTRPPRKLADEVSTATTTEEPDDDEFFGLVEVVFGYGDVSIPVSDDGTPTGVWDASVYVGSLSAPLQSAEAATTTEGVGDTDTTTAVAEENTEGVTTTTLLDEVTADGTQSGGRSATTTV